MTAVLSKREAVAVASKNQLAVNDEVYGENSISN
jgi:hypothetical protein